MLKDRLGEISTNVGRVAVCEVRNPYMGAEAWERAYAAVVIDAIETYSGPCVGMIITVLDERCAPPAYHEDPPRWWDPCVRTIKNVYRDPGFWLPSPDGTSVAVQVGRFLLREEAFINHSVSRTTAGSLWAERVGGGIPVNLDPITNSSTLDRHSLAALKRLQDDGWWRTLVVNPV